MEKSDLNKLKLTLSLTSKNGLDFIISATINNAKAFHLDSTIGSIKVGKHANMILMDKNPLKTTEAYNHIETIILGGSIIEREELSVQ